MLCELCNKKEATFHYKSTQNGYVTEKHLCESCAKKNGYEHMFQFPSISFGGLWQEMDQGMLGGLLGGMIDEGPQNVITETAVCPFCGMRLPEFMQTGKAGCSKCYTTFRSALTPTIKKLHGNTEHTGKAPAGRKESLSREYRLNDLKSQLAKAIESQEYEQAAKLRDEIKAMENDKHGEEGSK